MLIDSVTLHYIVEQLPNVMCNSAKEPVNSANVLTFLWDICYKSIFRAKFEGEDERRKGETKLE